MDNYSSPLVSRSSYPPGGGYNPGGGYPPQQPYYGATPPIGELAGLGGRILAFLIDRFLIGIIVGIGYAVFAVVALAGVASQSETGSALGGLAAVFMFIVLIAGAIAVMLFNEVYLAGKNNGQTIGKKMMGIRVAKEDGTPFGYGDAFLRNVVGYWISGLACGLGYFWGLFDSRQQAWHDKIFHTLVVRA